MTLTYVSGSIFTWRGAEIENSDFSRLIDGLIDCQGEEEVGRFEGSPCLGIPAALG